MLAFSRRQLLVLANLAPNEVVSNPGEGSVFVVYLPASEHVPEPLPSQSEAAAARGTETILLAEDDASVRMLTCRVLERAGYTVLPAVDGAEALELFEKNQGRIQFLLLDVVMPNIGGREVFDRIRARHPHLPVLFASGYNEDTVDSRFALTKGLHLLRKPYPAADLLRAIRATLDNGAQRELVVS